MIEILGLAILVMYCDVKTEKECNTEIMVLANNGPVTETDCHDTVKHVKQMMKAHKDNTFIKKYTCATENARIIMPPHLKVQKIEPNKDKEI